MKKLLIMLLLMVIPLVSSCASDNRKSSINRPLEDKPIVAATVFPLADLARQLGGGEIQVVTLLPAGASPHTFEPTPKEMKAVSQAGLLVSVGAGLDVWGQKLIKAIGVNVPEVVVGEGLELLPVGNHRHREEHSDAHHGEHDDHYHDGSGDPHVWLDPVLVKEEIAPMLAEALIKEWPQLTDLIQSNLLGLQQELTALDQEYRDTLALCPNRKFISFHATWGYLAHRYELEEIASVLEYPGQEPSARWLAELTDLARENKVEAVMIEPQFNPRPAELLAEEIEGKVFVLDPLGGEGVEGRDSYIQLLRYNLAVLKEALGS